MSWVPTPWCSRWAKRPLSLLGDTDGIQLRDGCVIVDQNMMTGHRGIFAGGDMVPDQRSVTAGVGHGKKAARNIDAWLAGRAPQPVGRPQIADFDTLNTWYYSDAPRSHRPRLELVRRQSTFDEVVEGLDETDALYEARRCMSCGNCFECDNCYGVCPDNAVLKIGRAGEPYLIDLDYCKGCGICASECPSGAIQMKPETI
jgi:Pyruvate/2-oxoacid:ferredoxin oxidoreductase delta subunit